MKGRSYKLNIFVLLCVVLLYSYPALSVVRVQGYYKQDGTYIAPHYRSSPNHTTSDNWSTKGNINPYTGKKGYKTFNSNKGIFINKNNRPVNAYQYNTQFISPYKIYKWIDKKGVTHYSDKPPSKKH